MAIITAALLDALRTGFRREFQQAYDSAMAASFYDRVSTTVPSTNASETYGWLGDFPDLREWVGDRVVKDMKEQAYQIANKEWESTVGVKRPQIEDDNLGIYTPMVRSMGQSAARHPDKLIAQLIKSGATELCYDGQNFFDTDHPVYANHDGTGAATTVANLDASGGASPYWYLLDVNHPLRPFIFQERKKPEFEAKTNPATSDIVFTSNEFQYGVYARHNVGFGLWQMAYASNATLDGTALDGAIRAMMEFKADGQRPLGIQPNLLVVPPALRAAANRTVKVMFEAGGGSNPNYEAVEVVVVPWLA
jgi:phage major head subunit gpT-like protein